MKETTPLSPQQVDELKGQVISEANAAYCLHANILKRNECLGSEAKMAKGTFGPLELKNLREANEYFGVHKGLHRALELLAPVFEQLHAAQVENKILRTYIGLTDKEGVISAEPNSMLIQRESTRFRISPAPELDSLRTANQKLEEANEKLSWALESQPCTCLEGDPCVRCVGLSEHRVALSTQPADVKIEPSLWRPIAEAPRDGTKILIWDGKNIFAAWWDDKFHCEWDDEKEDNVYTGDWTDAAVASFGYEEYQSYKPVLWMPLPPIPTTTGATANREQQP